MGSQRVVKPGESASYSVNIFAGAKELKLLEKYGQQYNIPLFERAIDFGWFHFITKPMYYLLIYFYAWLGNFGLSILMLTLCVKLVLFPLARKGYISMGRLKQLQPKIVEMQKRHKNDKMALQKNMMELYRKEKVNPAAGCLPILLQIPIFFSLYKVFFVSIEMRHAPFFGWIKDLSERDPTSIFNLFGLLPFEVPEMLMIGVFPCIMGLTMFIQQLLQPAPSDPMTAKMLRFMPLIFLFMFASFPAGLVIYWCFSNTLTIFQQLYFLRHHPRH
jgi:YidC/Oxa1 family membrane protein insertase